MRTTKPRMLRQMSADPYVSKSKRELVEAQAGVLGTAGAGAGAAAAAGGAAIVDGGGAELGPSAWRRPVRLVADFTPVRRDVLRFLGEAFESSALLRALRRQAAWRRRATLSLAS